MSNVNKIRKYKIIVKNISPLKIGNGEDEGFQLLLQDNKACISGTTIAGLFRTFLINNKELSEDDEIYKKIYPNSKDTSCIFFYDSFSDQDINDNDIEIRPHIRIDEKTETAVQNALFSECHISEGKTFKIILEVKGLELSEEHYESICEYLQEFLYLLGKGEISIGSKSTFGFGCMNFKGKEIYHLKEYDLTNEQDLEGYLEDEIDVIDDKFEFKNYKKEECTTITLRASCRDGLIIKGNKIKVNDTDTYKNISYGEGKINEKGFNRYVIPSSTIKGIVHAYSKKILLALGKDLDILNYIFGQKNDNEEKNKELKSNCKKGNLVFHDYKVEKDRINEQLYNRIKIDRFTGGIFTGSFFKDEVIIFNEETEELEFKVSISNKLKRLKENDRLFEKAIALIILTFRDMGLGYVTVGSGNNVGFGRIQGNYILLKTNEEMYKVDFENDKLVGDSGKFGEYIKILNE